MYIKELEFKVKDELDQAPELKERLGSFEYKFVQWCAKQRFIWESDLKSEVADFESLFINSRIYNTDVKLWKRISAEIFARDDYTCAYCGQKGGELEVDHIIPVSKGGTNDLMNLTTACRKCNRQKRDKTAFEFEEWRKKR